MCMDIACVTLLMKIEVDARDMPNALAVFSSVPHQTNNIMLQQLTFPHQWEGLNSEQSLKNVSLCIRKFSFHSCRTTTSCMKLQLSHQLSVLPGRTQHVLSWEYRLLTLLIGPEKECRRINLHLCWTWNMTNHLAIKLASCVWQSKIQRRSDRMATISDKFMVVLSLLDTQCRSTSLRSTNVRFHSDSLVLSPIPDVVNWIVVTASLDSFQRTNNLIFKYASVNKQNEQLMNR